MILRYINLTIYIALTLWNVCDCTDYTYPCWRSFGVAIQSADYLCDPSVEFNSFRC